MGFLPCFFKIMKRHEENQSAVKAVSLNYATEYKTDVQPYKPYDYDNRDFVPFGSDNLFPNACALFGRSSPNHRGVINSKVNYFTGDGLSVGDSALEYLINNANFENESLDAIIERLMIDDEMTGNAYLEIITDTNNSFIFFNQIDSTKVRLSREKPNVILFPDWTKYTDKHDDKREEIPLYPIFSQSRNKYGRYIYRSVLHLKAYEPEFTYYGIPRWLAGRDNVEIDLKTNRWNLSRLKNSFRLSGLLIVPVKDKNEGEQVLDYIEQNHIGAGENNKLLTITKSRAQEGEKADTTQYIETKQDDKGSWIELIKMSMTQVIIAHSWFRALTGVPDNTGFDTQRILNEYEVAMNTVITKRQDYFLDPVKKVLRDLKNIKEPKIEFINRPPLQDYRFMYVWEARRAKGLDFDMNDEEQKKIILSNNDSTNQ